MGVEEGLSKWGLRSRDEGLSKWGLRRRMRDWY